MSCYSSSAGTIACINRHEDDQASNTPAINILTVRYRLGRVLSVFAPLFERDMYNADHRIF